MCSSRVRIVFFSGDSAGARAPVGSEGAGSPSRASAAGGGVPIPEELARALLRPIKPRNKAYIQLFAGFLWVCAEERPLGAG